MLKQVGPREYEVTHLSLTEGESARLEQLMQRSDPAAAHDLSEAVERARGRLSERPLSELLQRQ